MRADRLLALLLLLQTRGRMTAVEIARELEVSERTIYRDLEALSTAGIPIYAERGPGGGLALLDSYRTTLTGLTTAEARVLLLLDIPEPLSRLGLGAELKTALHKVLAAAGQTASPIPIYLDWAGWGSMQQSAPTLPVLYQAICEHRQVNITYRLPIGVEVQRVVEPYGLVAKAGDWYLVAHGAGKLSLHRAADLTRASLSEQVFSPPAHFDLEAFWKAHARKVEDGLKNFRVRVRVQQANLDLLKQAFGEKLYALEQEQHTTDNGWVEFELGFESFETARAHLLRFGSAVEVLEPEQLRYSLLDFARQINRLYSSK